MKKIIKIGIIGLGNIGKKRLETIKKIKKYDIKISYIVDKFEKIPSNKKIKLYSDWKKVTKIPVDLVIISTPTLVTEKILKFLAGKKNILVEKPGTKNLEHLKKYLKISKKNNKILKIGYNLRYDDGLVKAKKIIEKKKIGKIYYIKICYANGAARTNSNAVGSLYDMGSHCINIIIWILKNENIKLISSTSQKNEFFQNKKIDNGFILMNVNKIKIFVHHGFCTWKNNFELEISGSRGLLLVKSLSKWGNQKIIYGRRNFPDGPPNVKTFFFKKDNSWKNELFDLINKIDKPKSYKFFNNEGIITLKTLKKIYA